MKPTYYIVLLNTLSMSLISAEAVARCGIRFGKGITGATSKTYTADTLFVSQLAACLKREDTIDSSALQLEQSEKDVNQHTDTLNKLDSEHDRLTQSIEKTDTSSLSTQYAVDTYNQKIVDYNAQLNKRNGLFADYEQIHIAYNSAVKQHNTLVSDFDLWCARALTTQGLMTSNKI